MEKVFLLFEDKDHDRPFGKGPSLISVHKNRESAEKAQKKMLNQEVSFIMDYQLHD